MYVSIHAPVRGATLLSGLGSIITDVSIHAPVRGATYAGKIGLKCLKFQSTRLCEARRIRIWTVKKRNLFQSTRLCEARRDMELAEQRFEKFQSTRLCEARLLHICS